MGWRMVFNHSSYRVCNWARIILASRHVTFLNQISDT